MAGEPLHHLTVCVDVQSSTSYLDNEKVVMRHAIADAVDRAFGNLATARSERRVEDRGDGVIVLVAATVPKSRMLGPWLRSFHRTLARHSERARRPFQVRVGMASGEVIDDGIGVVSSGLELACRLADAPVLKRLLRDAPSAPMAIAVSNEIYDSVVRHAPPGVDPALYRPADVRVKELATRAWIHVPGLLLPPLLETGEQRPASADPQGTAASGGGVYGVVRGEGAIAPITGGSGNTVTITSTNQHGGRRGGDGRDGDGRDGDPQGGGHGR